MSRPVFEYEVRTLLDLDSSMYDACGIHGNPFYYFCRERPRGLPERAKMRDQVVAFEGGNIYIAGHIIGGSGKTYLLNEIFSHYATASRVAVLRLENIVRYRFPKSAVDLLAAILEEKFKQLSEYTIIVLLDEVEFKELYNVALEHATRVIGAGHYPFRDCGERSRSMKVLDLDVVSRLGAEVVCRHINALVASVDATSLLTEAIVARVVAKTPTVGSAELVCGLLLAAFVRRTCDCVETVSLEAEVDFWCQQLGTNWFWFSMDCWRVRNPIDVVIGRSVDRARCDIHLQLRIECTIVEHPNLI